MTVQAGIETVTDLEVLVGEMEEQACEHSQHGVPGKSHSDEPASHYLQAFCDCNYATVYAACPEFVTFVLSNPKIRCATCGARGQASDLIHILAPITR
jgi:hypothetical protein